MKAPLSTTCTSASHDSKPVPRYCKLKEHRQQLDDTDVAALIASCQELQEVSFDALFVDEAGPWSFAHGFFLGIVMVCAGRT